MATGMDRWVRRVKDAKEDLAGHRARRSAYRSVLTEQGIARCVTLIEKTVNTVRDKRSTGGEVIRRSNLAATGCDDLQAREMR